MGMTIMQTFADDFHIESERKGTLVTIKKRSIMEKTASNEAD